MGIRLYKLRNFGGVATGYVVTGAIATASFLIGVPWVFAGAAAVTTGLTWAGLRANKKVIENDLIEHPKVHRFSPDLGKMVEELYRESGLSRDKFPIYDFKIKPKEEMGKRTAGEKLLHKMLGTMSDTPNAAALFLDKPVIIISEPLLKLLNHAEEKAVLAHEFAHAAAMHQHVAIPQKLFGAASRLSNNVLHFVTAAAVGLFTLAATFMGSIALGVGAAFAHPAREKAMNAKEEKSPENIQAKRQSLVLANVVATGSYVGIISALNPAFAPIWAAVTSLNAVSKVAEKTLSRSKEYQADRGAVDLGANPLALIMALRKIEAIQKRSYRDHFGYDPVQPGGQLTHVWKNLNSTHPTMDRRIHRLADIARECGYKEQDIQETMSVTPDIRKADNIPYHIMEAMTSRLV